MLEFIDNLSLSLLKTSFIIYLFGVTNVELVLLLLSKIFYILDILLFVEELILFKFIIEIPIPINLFEFIFYVNRIIY